VHILRGASLLHRLRRKCTGWNWHPAPVSKLLREILYYLQYTVVV